MNQFIFAGAVAAGLALPSLSFAHGGTYRGPQDTVPPSGGSGGGGGQPAAPSTPGNGQPQGPGMRPGTGTPARSPSGSPRGPAVKTGDSSAGIELTGWEYWWLFNKDPYLALKARLAANDVQTGSDEHYLGRGERAQSRDTRRVGEERIRGQIVPELMKALASEPSKDIQSSCMIALAKIGEARAEDGAAPIAEAIRPFLDSPNQELSETAAIALGILATPENIPWLTAVLENDLRAVRELGLRVTKDFSVRTRAFAAYGLGLTAHKATQVEREVINATLRRYLDGEGRAAAQRDVPVACLTSIGLAALDFDAGDAGAEGGARIAPPKSLVSLQDQLRYLLAYSTDESNNYLTRAHAPTAIARLLAAGNVPDALPLRRAIAEKFIEQLASTSRAPDAVQQSCALALGVIGDSDEDPIDKSIRAALMRAQAEPGDQQTGRFALIALAQAAGRPGRGLGNPIDGVDTANKQENARSFLLNVLSRGKGGMESWAGVALAVLERGLEDAKVGSSGDAKLALASALAEAGTPSKIGAYAIACGLTSNAAAKEELLRRLEQCNDPEARGNVAIGLGLMNETAALGKIQEILRKSKYQPELLKSAAIALGLLGDRMVVDDLVEMLKKASGLSSQAAVSSALGFIGDSRSVDPLVDLLTSPDEHTDIARAFAAVSLGLIADKESLPWNSKFAVNSNYRANTETLTNQTTGILDIL